MKEAEYFQRARDDAGFRRDKIRELREHKSLTGWALVCIGGLLAVIWITLSLLERRWLNLGGALSSMILIAAVYGNTCTRLAALETMDGKTTEPSGEPQQASPR